MNKLNLDKMLRVLARNTPDSIWRSFNIDSPTIAEDLTSWREHWIRMMEIKHAGKNMQLVVFDSEMTDDISVKCFKLTAVERKP